MEMTLDESLAEIDKWKNAAVELLTNLSPSERARLGEDAIAWLEREIGRPLERVPAPEPETANGG